MFMVRTKKTKNESKLCAYLNITIFFVFLFPLAHQNGMATASCSLRLVNLRFIGPNSQATEKKRRGDRARNANKQLNKMEFCEIACSVNEFGIDCKNEATELTRLENIVLT